MKFVLSSFPNKNAKLSTDTIEDVTNDVFPRQGTYYTNQIHYIPQTYFLSFTLRNQCSSLRVALNWQFITITLAFNMKLNFVGQIFSMKIKNGYSAFILRRAFQIASLGTVNVLILTPYKQLSVKITLKYQK
jgi:hypothetical protein